MERDFEFFDNEMYIPNFNSHAHVERDQRFLRASNHFCIISTHTLTWSVTQEDSQIEIKITNFNSHAHVERDYSDVFKQSFNKISTHTLTWSVTS